MLIHNKGVSALYAPCLCVHNEPSAGADNSSLLYALRGNLHFAVGLKEGKIPHSKEPLHALVPSGGIKLISPPERAVEFNPYSAQHPHLLAFNKVVITKA